MAQWYGHVTIVSVIALSRSIQEIPDCSQLRQYAIPRHKDRENLAAQVVLYQPKKNYGVSVSLVYECALEGMAGLVLENPYKPLTCPHSLNMHSLIFETDEKVGEEEAINKAIKIWKDHIPHVFYLLLLFYSAEASTQRLPNCKKKLGEKAIQNEHIRERLAVGVIVAKPQVQGPKYICELEKRAYELVRSDAPRPENRTNVVFDEGTRRPNLNTVLSKWSEDLKKMGEKEKFGCNLSIFNGGYKIACLFK